MNPFFPARSLLPVLGGFLLLAAIPQRLPSAEAPSGPQIPAVVLIEPTDHTALDQQIVAVQQRLPHSVQPAAELERLGWLFVAKARASSDPGFYTLAGIAADALEKNFHHETEAWLLQGHVLHTRHRFAEAEALARRLVAARGEADDYALLGDALYDEGKTAEAAVAYQQLMDLRPGLEAYSRAANIRWLKGDLAGAIMLQAEAVRAGSARDPATLAWTLTRLGQLTWTQGRADDAAALARRASELLPDFPAALILQGRLLLAAGRANEALVPLARAVAVLPLPEPRWVYAEALRAAGRESEAKSIEASLVRDGAAEDPRTVALFLSTDGRDAAEAARLATDELANRADVLTHAACALALAEAGRADEAVVHAHAALAEGTIDAHLLLQAGRALALAGQPDAADVLARAGRISGTLLPSERRLLDNSFTRQLADANSRTVASLNPIGNQNETHN
jgi:tetratricopeptide (TPR) repeat protein